MFQARLKVLKARDDHVAHVLDDAKKQLTKIAHDRSKYPAIIEKLIAQVGADCGHCKTFGRKEIYFTQLTRQNLENMLTT